MNNRHIIAIIAVLFFSGCATYAGFNYDSLFGDEVVREREVPYQSPIAQHYINHVKPVIDNRCVVCHACYDAPCQYKMSSPQGIDRGGSKNTVYQGTRLIASSPTRLFEDAETTQEWREADFHPVLNERSQYSQPNIEAGLMAKMLMQKERYPQPEQKQLEDFDFSIYREEQCPTVEEHAQYESDYPTWGMPFGMPNLATEDLNTLIDWLSAGAKMAAHKPMSVDEQKQIAKWEVFLNNNDIKSQLSARYIYEHVYLFHLYFSELDGEKRFFTMVRSATPPGKPIKRISTRRPYDDPGVERVYYRLIPELATIVDKTHMPYALNEQRMTKWQQWFLQADYQVSQLPSYSPQVAANPLTAFKDIPVKTRFSFLVDGAHNTIMAFIKGPVCRGQLALNVINDRFWVFFLNPEHMANEEINQFYIDQARNLALPGEKESNIEPVINWINYSNQQTRYLQAKSDFTNKWFNQHQKLNTDVLWHGDSLNDNAVLTVFRHFDSASVVKGLVGQKPKTAWIIDYAMLERIHYLLVAGFDVYGNFGHQLVTRMYMDFLRLEGESHFLTLIPNEVRHKEHSSWYQDQSASLSQFFQRNIKPFSQPTAINYHSDDPKSELFDMLKEKYQSVLSDRYQIVDTGLTAENNKILSKIDHLIGFPSATIPQISMIMVTSHKGEQQLFTLLRNNAHKNISSLFSEDANRLPEKDSLTLVRGVLGSYPAAFFKLHERDIGEFYTLLSAIDSEEDYIKLLDRFGIRRTSPEFWQFSDQLSAWYKQDQPIEFGLLDYNRFENR